MIRRPGNALARLGMSRNVSQFSPRRLLRNISSLLAQLSASSAIVKSSLSSAVQMAHANGCHQ